MQRAGVKLHHEAERAFVHDAAVELARPGTALRGPDRHLQLPLEATLVARRGAHLQALYRHILDAPIGPRQATSVHDTGSAAPDDCARVVGDVLRAQRAGGHAPPL